MTARLLVIDNYDSFTFNLVQMFRRYDLLVSVVRADALSVDDVGPLAPDYVLVSPGPKAPSSAGISIELIRRYFQTVPILGVCLGMQCINEAFGGRTVRAPIPMHGKRCDVRHDGSGLFVGVPSPFTVARYHSLMLTGIDPVLRVSARSGDDVVMAIQHKDFPLYGVQFHPESFLTDHGFVLIENFLKIGPCKGSIK